LSAPAMTWSCMTATTNLRFRLCRLGPTSKIWLARGWSVPSGLIRSPKPETGALDLAEVVDCGRRKVPGQQRSDQFLAVIEEVI